MFLIDYMATYCKMFLHKYYRRFPNSNDAMQPHHENEANHDKMFEAI